MGRYYRRDGSAVETWAEIPIDELQNKIGDTNIGSINVATIFTGYNLGSEDKPKIFETIVHGGMYDKSREVYSSEKAALKGHKKWVNLSSVDVPEDIAILGNAISSAGDLNAYRIAKYLIENGIVKVNEQK